MSMAVGEGSGAVEEMEREAGIAPARSTDS